MLFSYYYIFSCICYFIYQLCFILLYNLKNLFIYVNFNYHHLHVFIIVFLHLFLQDFIFIVIFNLNLNVLIELFNFFFDHLLIIN